MSCVFTSYFGNACINLSDGKTREHL